MRLINLTPYLVRIANINIEGGTLDIEPTLPPARVFVRHEVARYICDGIVPIYRTVYGDIVDLPPQQEGVGYIVSQMVAQAAPHRADLLVPASGHPAVERRDGLIYSVPGLVSLHQEASHA